MSPTTSSAPAPDIVETPAPDTRRGRPRSEACTTDILTAVLDLVAEVGIADLTVESVAARAGVGKATIYRRWASKESLMLDAWMSCVRAPEVPDTGNLRDDLLTLLGRFEHPIGERDVRRVFPQMIAAAKVNPDVAEAYRAYIAERRWPMEAILRRAADRGEIRAGVDLEVVHDLLVAPLLYRWLLTDAPVDDGVFERIISIVLAGIA